MKTTKRSITYFDRFKELASYYGSQKDTEPIDKSIKSTLFCYDMGRYFECIRCGRRLCNCLWRISETVVHAPKYIKRRLYAMPLSERQALRFLLSSYYDPRSKCIGDLHITTVKTKD